MVKTMGNPEFHSTASHLDPILSGQAFEGENGVMIRILENGSVIALVELEAPVRMPEPVQGFETMSSTLPIAPEVQQEPLPVPATSSSNEFHFEATTTTTYSVKGNGIIPESVVEAFRGGLPNNQLAQIGGTALDSTTNYSRPNTTRLTSPSTHGGESNGERRKKTKKIYSLGLKKGGVYWPAILGFTIVTGTVLTGLGIQTLNDATHVGKVCETPLAVATKEATGVDLAQGCEVASLWGDVTNVLNLVTGERNG
jgi:hypothetical protein